MASVVTYTPINHPSDEVVNRNLVAIKNAVKLLSEAIPSTATSTSTATVAAVGLSLVPSASFVVAENFGAYYPERFEIPGGISVELGLGAVVEIG